MPEIAETGSLARADASRDEALERRILRSMCVAVALAGALSAMLAPWRVTTGLLLGGVLSLFNHHWLRSSIAAGFRVSESEPRPRLGASRFVLRYFVVACVIASAVALGVVSLVAAIVGMCSFVAAIFVEACRHFYFALTHREEI
ncbi:MAG: hypothetical protein QOF61_1255 [Acidobacteriota bacterium]|jgi:hypothetical protein|nr:hypothetical protein [Acidobacteriota bacterium]